MTAIAFDRPLRPLSSNTSNAGTPATSAPTLLSRPWLRATFVGGLAVGVLDALDGVTWFGITAGLNPIQVLQFIASGLLGKAALQGGLATAGLGTLIHFGLAVAFTALFAVGYATLSAVRAHWAGVGLLFGAAVWAFMNLVALPLSAIGAASLGAGTVIHGLVGHALFVGLTAAYMVRRGLAR